GVLVEHGARSSKRGVLGRRQRRLGGLAGQRIGRRCGVFQTGRGGAEERGGEEFDFSPIVGFEDVAFQAGGTVRQLPSAGRLVALHVERDAVKGQLGPVHRSEE